MPKYKVIKQFIGKYKGYFGAVIDIPESEALDLLQAGYIEKVAVKRTATKNPKKRTTSK